jgi:hypothetical protein
MRRLILPLVGTPVSVACAFAAVGVALYGQGDWLAAGTLYGVCGAAVGFAGTLLDLAWLRLPAPARPDNGPPRPGQPLRPPTPVRPAGGPACFKPSRFGA